MYGFLKKEASCFIVSVLISTGFSECSSSRRLQEEITLNQPTAAENNIIQHNELWRRTSSSWWLDMWGALLRLAKVDSNSRRSALSKKINLVRSSIEKTIGFPSKSDYFAFWKKLFLFDIVSNVARVGGSLLLFLFAPDLYQMLPAAVVG